MAIIKRAPSPSVVFAERGEGENHVTVYRTAGGAWTPNFRHARVYRNYTAAKRAASMIMRRLDWDRYHTIGSKLRPAELMGEWL